MPYWAPPPIASRSQGSVIYPILAAPAMLVANGAAFTYGAFVSVIAANVIGKSLLYAAYPVIQGQFNSVYFVEIRISGNVILAETFTVRSYFSTDVGYNAWPPFYFPSPQFLIPANADVSARCATNVGGGNLQLAVGVVPA